MIEGVTFPDSYAYKIVVPTANKTHKPHYLAHVNSSFSAFLSEVAPENVFPIGHHHIIRNISPHGLGGVLVFDASERNFFELPLERQYNMEDRVERIVDFLEANYGQDFHVVTGMATSSDPGSGRGQSIAFAHIHISLLPKNLPAD
jgi:diadenosine tetraphosphate (Ap4A) HIT family hydrolase